MLKELLTLGAAIENKEKAKPFGEAILSTASWFLTVVLLTYTGSLLGESQGGIAAFLLSDFVCTVLYISFSAFFISRLVYIFKHRR